MAFGFKALSEWLDASGILASTVFNGIGLVPCLMIMVTGLLRLKEGPPEDADWSEYSQWQASTYMMIAAVPLFALLFGAFSLIG
jgi:hypothetical protein